MFACRCFCALTEYSHEKTTVPISTRLGFTVDALPLTDIDDLQYWMEVEGMSDVRLKIDRGKILSLEEYSVGGIIKSPPVLSIGERELLLDRQTKGGYGKLKKQMEIGVNNNAIALEGTLKDMANKNGVDIVTPGIDDNEAEILIITDTDRYSNRKDKQKAWKSVCKKHCREVAESDSRHFWFVPHKEFAFYKSKNAPFATGRYYSDEMIHGHAMGSVPTKWEKEYKSWAAPIDKRFTPLFTNILREDRRAKCSELRFKPSQGQRTTWENLRQRFGILKNPYYLYPPNRPLSIPMTGTDIMAINRDIFGQARRILGESKLNNVELPTLMPYDDEKDWNATSTLGGWIQHRGIKVASWPAQAPQFVSWRVGGEWKNKAMVAVAKSGPAQYNYKVTSLYEGRRENAGKRQFYNVFVREEDVLRLIASMRQILVDHWAHDICTQYLQSQSSFRFAAELDSSSSSSRSSVDITPTAAAAASSADDSDGGSSLGSAIYDEDDGVSLLQLQHQGSRRRKKKRSKPTLTTDIIAIEFTYLTSVWLSCWHTQVDNKYKPDNRLMFSALPLTAVIYTTDGQNYKVPLSPSPRTIGTISNESEGFIQMSFATPKAFWSEMESLRHRECRIFREILFKYFKLNDGGKSYLAHRNLCSLVDTAEDVSVPDIMPAEKYQFYYSEDPANADRIKLEIPSVELRQTVGTMLLKCFGVLPPEGTFLKQDKKGTKVRYTCSDVPANKQYKLVQRSY